MDDAVNSWFRPHDTELTFWRDLSTPTLSWPHWKARFTWQQPFDLIPVPGRTVYRSFTTLRPGQLPPPAGFSLVDTWSSQPTRLVWIYLPERIVLSYTEGELAYLVCSTPEAWRAAIGELNTFYRHH